MPCRIYSFTCEACGVEFTRKSYRAQFCGVNCRNAFAAQKRYWKKEEDEYLLSLIGRYQPRQIIDKWSAEAKKRGWYRRTNTSVQDRITNLCRIRGITSKSVKDNWTGSDLARALDITRDRVKSWEVRGLILERYNYDGDVYKGFVIITRKNLVKFALARPDLFHSIAIPKLSKVLRDKEAIALIKQVNTKPLNYRGCSIVRLDTGYIYPNAVQAAEEAGISSKAILYNIKDGSGPMMNGMDWARVEYPIHVVPLAVRAIFSYEAARIFYHLYCDLVVIEGYSKRSVLIVAIRMAVQITMMAFRRQWKEVQKDIAITPLEEIQNYWRDRFIENLKKFYGHDEQQCWQVIDRTAKQKAYPLFVNRKRYELDEFVLWLTRQYSEKYNKEYLPIDYQPRTQLEKADYFAFIFQLLFAWLDRGDRRISMINIMFYNYAYKYLSPSSFEYDEGFLSHNNYDTEGDLLVTKEEWKEQIVSAVRAADMGDDSILDMLASVLEKHFNEYQQNNENLALEF